MDAEGQASCVLWYADSVVVLVVVILRKQMSVMVNLTLTKIKIALVPRELRREETFDAILHCIVPMPLCVHIPPM